jgi:hypothetical protein
MRDTTVQWAMSEIQREIDDAAGQIIRGIATDYADYRRGCGHVFGLSRAREILLAAVSKEAEGEEENA